MATTMEIYFKKEKNVKSKKLNPKFKTTVTGNSLVHWVPMLFEISPLTKLDF